MRPVKPDNLAQAILLTVAYADIFNSPLHPTQLWRYLIGWSAQPDEVRRALKHQLQSGDHLNETKGWLHLPGRSAIVTARIAVAPRVAHLRRQAVRYGRCLATLPFVRMVALTGGLANHHPTGPRPDFDYMIITQPGFLWLVRAMALALARLTAPLGGRICPNYLISIHQLALPVPGLYPAQELVRMVPLAGQTVYQQLRTANPWTDSFLPNAAGPPPDTPRPPRARLPLQWVGERILDSYPGRRLEQWEMQRKLQKLRSQPGLLAEVDLGPDVCKGHFDGHAGKIARAWDLRLEALGLGRTEVPNSSTESL